METTAPATKDFILTFPLRFARHDEEHPTFPAAHPDGWVRITAPSYDEARTYAFKTFGTQWAFLYNDTFLVNTHGLYPMGELTHHTVGAEPTHEPTC